MSDRRDLLVAWLADRLGVTGDLMSTLPSWPALKAEVEALTRTLAEAVEAFLTASVSGRIGRAGQFLAQHPGISGHDFGPRSRWVTPPASMLS